jgi:hypothetical protein
VTSYLLRISSILGIPFLGMELVSLYYGALELQHLSMFVQELVTDRRK